MVNTFNEKTLDLVRQFCTPPFLELSDGEKKFIDRADRFNVLFEDYQLNCYSYGEGLPVLLCHGWGSRASHMALSAMAVTRSGFRVIIFDAPAHSSVPDAERKKYTNMFDFARAISAVARSIPGLYALVGHSLGGLASIFALAAFPHMEQFSFYLPKLVLLNVPAGLSCVTSNFSRENNLDAEEQGILENGLQSAFSLKINDYISINALKKIQSDILVIQDNDDERFYTNERLSDHLQPDSLKVLLTSGYGHDRILAGREVHKEIISFLSK